MGIFEQLWSIAVETYDELVGLDREWQSVDGAMTKAPIGGEDTGKNPTDRGKRGTKRSVQTDGGGIPIGLTVAGANVHDTKLLQQTIEDSIERAVAELHEEEHLCLDKAYDSAAIRKMVPRSTNTPRTSEAAEKSSVSWIENPASAQDVGLSSGRMDG